MKRNFFSARAEPAITASLLRLRNAAKRTNGKLTRRARAELATLDARKLASGDRQRTETADARLFDGLFPTQVLGEPAETAVALERVVGEVSARSTQQIQVPAEVLR